MATKLQNADNILWEAIPSEVRYSSRPTVLIFDSGVGGLSVYKEIQQLLPDIHYVYLFDNLCFPYGEKSEEFIVKRVLDIVTAVQRQHHLILVVIACNTASTVSLPALRERFTFPVVGVVPAIKPAAKLTRNGIVGLLATRATVQRPYTLDLIRRFAGDCKIELLGSAELVELAEAKLHGEIIALSILKNILYPWLKMREPPDTVVLGCTHFPLLIEELSQVLPEGTQMIDSGKAIAQRAACLVRSQVDVMSIQNIQNENIAYCTELNTNVNKLYFMLKSYGFFALQKLVI